MGLFDKAKKLAEKASPLIDKAAPHAREAMDKAGQQIDKRTDGKYHDQLEQAEEKVGELADKRMAENGTAAATADAFPVTPPAAGGRPATEGTPAASADDGFPPTPAPVPPAAHPEDPTGSRAT